MLRTAALAGALLAASLARADEAAVSKADRIKGAVFGALVGDALCLGSHYEYDAKVIKQAYGGKALDKFMAPGERMGGTTHGVGWGRRNYHPGQKAGDQTDYGEYNVLMLEYLAEHHDAAKPMIELKDLLPFWKQYVNSKKWGCWKCTQTKTTLQQVAQGVREQQLGGNSNAMAFRSAGALGIYDTERELVEATRKMMFTHKSREALDGGEFVARAVYRIIHEGMGPREALEAAAKPMSAWIKQQVKKGVDKFLEATDKSKPLGREEYVDDLAVTSMARLWDVGKTEPIRVGKASPTEGVLPSSIYFILKHQDDLLEALKANAMVGGDNASRSIVIGTILGAWHGVNAIPEKFKTTLNAYEKCDRWVGSLPLLKGVQETEL